MGIEAKISKHAQFIKHCSTFAHLLADFGTLNVVGEGIQPMTSEQL